MTGEERILANQDKLFKLVNTYHAQNLILQGRLTTHERLTDAWLSELKQANAEQHTFNERLAKIVERHDRKFVFFSGVTAVLVIIGGFVGWLLDKVVSNWSSLLQLKGR